MAAPEVLLFAFLIGCFSGLRCLTPTAVTAWAAHLGWLKVPSALSWIGATTTAVIFTLLALVELVTDKLPKTPSRTAPPGLITRILLGALSGACVASAGGEGIVLGAVLGIMGALAGTYGGYQARKRLVKALGTPGFRDCPLGRPCDHCWVAVGCFALLNFSASKAFPHQRTGTMFNDLLILILSSFPGRKMVGLICWLGTRLVFQVRGL